LRKRILGVAARGALLFGLLLFLVETCAAGGAAAAPTERGTAAAAPTAVALGEKYENGESVAKSYGRARMLYCQAAEKGDAEAAFNLAWMYLNGRGVRRDDAIAAAWLRRAAKGGIAQAGNLLALLPQRSSDTVGNSCVSSAMSAAARSAPTPRMRELIDATAHDIGINPDLLSSVMAVESGFDPRAVSPKMAAGLMQLMPDTAVRYGVRDVFDERENVRGGAAYLRDLLRMFDGNLALALAAYNAGEAKVVLYRGVPPYPETENYVTAVRKLCACE
jgi:soluble lytic murein transglycosylase-like protein